MSNIEWTDKYNYNPPIELTAEPQPGVMLSIWYEKSQFTGNLNIERNQEKAFFWRIEIGDKDFEHRLYYLCSLDLYSTFLSLEDCKKQVENHYQEKLIQLIKNEITDRSNALKVLNKGTKSMSNIEWTDETLNVIVGCDKISTGCQNCYAIDQAYRNNAIAQKLKADSKNLGRLEYYEGLTERIGDRKEWTGKIAFVPEALEIPFKRKKPTRYFVNSMGDLFHKDVTDSQLDQIFAVMALTPHHVYQVLTKRPERLHEYCKTAKQRIRIAAVDIGKAKGIDHEIFETCQWDYPLPNVWLGVSVENQKAADERIPLLLKTPSSKRFVSCEPLLEKIEIYNYLTSPFRYEPRTRDNPHPPVLDWVIAGAESGYNARHMDESWIRDLARQCEGAEVPFFYKQNVVNGKKISMPELDGKVWNQMP